MPTLSPLPFSLKELCELNGSFSISIYLWLQIAVTTNYEYRRKKTFCDRGKKNKFEMAQKGRCAYVEKRSRERELYLISISIKSNGIDTRIDSFCVYFNRQIAICWSSTVVSRVWQARRQQSDFLSMYHHRILHTPYNTELKLGDETKKKKRWEEWRRTKKKTRIHSSFYMPCNPICTHMYKKINVYLILVIAKNITYKHTAFQNWYVAHAQCNEKSGTKCQVRWKKGVRVRQSIRNIDTESEIGKSFSYTHFHSATGKRFNNTYTILICTLCTHRRTRTQTKTRWTCAHIQVSGMSESDRE